MWVKCEDVLLNLDFVHRVEVRKEEEKYIVVVKQQSGVNESLWRFILAEFDSHDKASAFICELYAKLGNVGKAITDKQFGK